MKRTSKLLLIIAVICLAVTSCSMEQDWPIEALNAEEFTYYADNANEFADSVLESGADFYYVQLAYGDDKALSEDDYAVGSDNADGICSMIEGDYHNVIDMRSNISSINKKLKLKADAKILVIGDACGENKVYEELAKEYNNIDYLNSVGVSDDDYDKIYETATTAGWDVVIVANDVAAFHEQSFPFAAE